MLTQFLNTGFENSLGRRRFGGWILRSNFKVIESVSLLASLNVLEPSLSFFSPPLWHLFPFFLSCRSIIALSLPLRCSWFNFLDRKYILLRLLPIYLFCHLSLSSIHSSFHFLLLSFFFSHDEFFFSFEFNLTSGFIILSYVCSVRKV